LEYYVLKSSRNAAVNCYGERTATAEINLTQIRVNTFRQSTFYWIKGPS